MATIYLTFDDGPLAGTDDVIAVLNSKQIRGSLFMVGVHVVNDWRKKQVNDAHSSKYAEVANHSTTHADNKYSEYYKKPEDVLAGFQQATKTLKITAKPVPARLPGRNTWRLAGIIRTDGDSGPAANNLTQNGFKVYGWDVEWRMSNGRPVESADEMISKVANILKSKGTQKNDKVIVLTHDTMFRASTGGRPKLESFIEKLKTAGYSMDFVTNY